MSCRSIRKKSYKTDPSVSNLNLSSLQRTEDRLLLIDYQNYLFDDQSKLALDYSKAKLPLYSAPVVSELSLVEAPSDPELHTWMSQHKFQKVDVLEDGKINVKDAEKSCFRFLLDKNIGLWLGDAKSDVEAAVGGFKKNWNILTAGDLCTDAEGRLLYFNNKSELAVPYISNSNFLKYLQSKGLSSSPSTRQGLGLSSSSRLPFPHGLPGAASLPDVAPIPSRTSVSSGERQNAKNNSETNDTDKIFDDVASEGEDGEAIFVPPPPSGVALNFKKNVINDKYRESSSRIFDSGNTLVQDPDVILEMNSKIDEILKSIKSQEDFQSKFTFSKKISAIKYNRVSEQVDEYTFTHTINGKKYTVSFILKKTDSLVSHRKKLEEFQKYGDKDVSLSMKAAWQEGEFGYTLLPKFQADRINEQYHETFHVLDSDFKAERPELLQQMNSAMNEALRKITTQEDFEKSFKKSKNLGKGAFGEVDEYTFTHKINKITFGNVEKLLF